MSAPYSINEHPAILQAKQQAKAQSQKMSITQTFYLAHQARGKLSSEAAKNDHQLRHLVGHANLLDRLMLHLSQAEEEQDAWFSNMVRGSEVEESASERLQLWETIPEEEEQQVSWAPEDYSDSDSDSDDEEYSMEEDFSLFPALTQTSSRKPATQSYSDTVVGIDEVEEYSDEEEDSDSDSDGLYTLQRTTSHRPPSLVSDSDEEQDDDDFTPPSPPQVSVSPVLSEKQRKQLVTTSYYDESSEDQTLEGDFFLSSTQNAISAY